MRKIKCFSLGFLLTFLLFIPVFVWSNRYFDAEGGADVDSVYDVTLLSYLIAGAVFRF